MHLYILSINHSQESEYIKVILDVVISMHRLLFLKEGSVEATRALNCDLLEAFEELNLEVVHLFHCVKRRLPETLVVLHEGFEVESLLGGCEVVAKFGVIGIVVDIGGPRRSSNANSIRKKERSINVL
jgi:hypothetical protein